MKKGLDYHIHTKYMKCADETMTIERIFRRCEELSLSSIGVTDHFHSEKDLSEHLKIKKDIENTSTKLEVFFGAEVDFLKEGNNLSCDNEIKEAAGFQYVIAGIHQPFIDEYNLKNLVNNHHYFLCLLAENPLVDVIAHPWWFSKRIFQKKNFPWFDDLSVIPENFHLEFARTAKENHKAVEVNALSIFCTDAYSDKFKKQYEEYLAILKGTGVKFSIGSDAHSISELGITKIIEEILERVGVTEEQIWSPHNIGEKI